MNALAATHLPYSHIGVVIPAHNEADHIGACLAALKVAQSTLQQHYPQVTVEILVVLDSCEDATHQIVDAAQIASITCDFRRVGQTRASGIDTLIKRGATWLACSDADSQVDADWLLSQYRHLNDTHTHTQPDMICGVVYIADWGELTPQVQHDYLAHYRDEMQHHHIHGANLSFSADAYQAVGGFSALPCHEDVDLVRRFEAQGFNLCWSNQVRVVTSSRLVARADEGFAHFLKNLQHAPFH